MVRVDWRGGGGAGGVSTTPIFASQSWLSWCHARNVLTGAGVLSLITCCQERLGIECSS